MFSHRAVAQPSPATRPAGPFLVIVPAIIAVRAPSMGMMLSAFFENDALVWITGSLLLFGGLLIIAHHQYLVEPGGDPHLAVRLVFWLCAACCWPAPQLYGGAAAMNMMPIVQIVFAFLVLVGLLLTFVGWIAKSPANGR
jgi:hypothetical protein